MNNTVSAIRRLVWAAVIGAVVLLAACGSGEAPRAASIEALTGTPVVTGLDRPTQLFVDEEAGAWYVAQLAGGENAGSGEVVRIDPTDLDAEPVVVLGDLDKPTGVAVFGGRVWVMERNRLSHSALDGSNTTVVLEEMVFNGRSQGTLTVDGDRLLFDTSGKLSVRTDEPVDPSVSSGVLWAIDNAGEISAVASGFKHAYAHTRAPDGTLWSTEMSDGSFDGQRAQDELVAIREGADHGWPRCVGDNRPVVEFDAGPADCADVPRSQALLGISSTPTSVVVAPWDPATLLVSLWVDGEVVAVTADPDAAPTEPVVVYGDAENPQHLAIDGDRVLLVEHTAGRIVSLQPG